MTYDFLIAQKEYFDAFTNPVAGPVEEFDLANVLNVSESVGVNAYASHREIHAISTVLQRNIWIWNINYTVWTKIQDHEDTSDWEIIYLLYTGNHYDLLKPV
jgi:hypothetical protein